MNKKLALLMVLVLVFSIGAGMGTMALYQKSFETESNVVTAAKFDPNNTGTAVIELDNDDIYPQMGMTEVADVVLQMNNTEVDTTFTVDFTADGGVFAAMNGLKERVYYYVYDGEKLVASNDPTDDVEDDFYIELSKGAEDMNLVVKLDWANEDNKDIQWQGLGGTFLVDVSAIQSNIE